MCAPEVDMRGAAGLVSRGGLSWFVCVSYCEGEPIASSWYEKAPVSGLLHGYAIPGRLERLGTDKLWLPLSAGAGSVPLAHKAGRATGRESAALSRTEGSSVGTMRSRSPGTEDDGGEEGVGKLGRGEWRGGGEKTRIISLAVYSDSAELAADGGPSACVRAG